MSRHLKISAVLACCILLFASIAQAKGPIYTDPAKTDADFAFQGEYRGEIDAGGTKIKIGVQVIALGEGKFRSISFLGGLPGDGTNSQIVTPPSGDNEKRTMSGELKDGVVIFDNDHAHGEIKGGKMHVTAKQGNASGILEKVTRKSPTLGKKAPAGATVLFDGSNADNFNGGKIKDGLLQAGCTSKERFGSHKLHIEFRLPYQPQDRGQGRGNSGIYLQGRYECQMLDSFGLKGENNECGGLYSVKAPDLNMCFPPLTWQTYDIDYTAGKYDDAGKVVTNPRVTIRHNGVIIHNDVELPGERSTTAAPSKPGNEPGPIYLQRHGAPVVYQNIWLVPKDG
jgi:hypothetical protein